MKELVHRQKAERDELLGKRYIPRQALQNARSSMNDTLIKVITGPRRAGKSVFAIELLAGIDFAYLNFDDEQLLGVGDYDALLKAIREVYGETKVFLFDEIQNLPKWELFVNRLHRRGFTVVITGSNSRMLSRELATHLTGRYRQFQILPFSFGEYLEARGFTVEETVSLKEKQGSLLNHLNEYLSSGGYPEVVIKGIEPKSYLTTLFESILFKDVVKRYNIRYSKKLHDLAIYLITNHSSEFSYTRLKNNLSFRSVHTVENYIEYLMEAFVLFTLDRYSHKVREQMKSPRKVYAYDTGAIQAMKFKISPDAGKLMENVVAVELLRRGNEFYFFKTRDGKEVDFAVKEGLSITHLIQVSYDVGDDKTRKRESSALGKAAQETGCKSLMALTWDTQADESLGDQTVHYLPLWKWLLGK